MAASWHRASNLRGRHIDNGVQIEVRVINEFYRGSRANSKVNPLHLIVPYVPRVYKTNIKLPI